MAEKKSWARRVGIAVVALLVVVVVALFGIGNYLVDYAIGKAGDGGNRQVALEVDQDAVNDSLSQAELNIQKQTEMNEEFLAAVTPEKVSVQSDDGLNLVGAYYENCDSHVWAIVIHGYRSSGAGMVSFAQRYYQQGFQVIAPDLRACGESEGGYVGMGWLDRKDILCWVNWIMEKDPQAKIVLHGISMGGATVMMTSGEETPDSVVAFVEDCGYTSVWDIFASELQLRFGLPVHPILDVAGMVAGMKAGYSFDGASSLEQIVNCNKPMLFFHGDQDDFVPFWCLQQVYDAKPGDNKKMIVAKNAGHGEAKNVLGEEYWDETFAFLSKYL